MNMSTSEHKSESKSMCGLDLLLLLIPLAGIMGTFASFYRSFDATWVVLAAVMVTGFFGFVFRKKLVFFSTPKLQKSFYLILLVTILLRSVVYVYVVGGQDQGVYVSLAKYIERTGSFFVDEDTTVEKIPEESRAYYLKHRPQFYGHYFSFYPVHPVLMAICNDFFGDDWTTLSLAVMGVLTAIAFYLITLRISGNRNLALLMMAFIGLHPVHKFLSMFPVTEVPALFFTSFTFYYFLRFLDGIKGHDYPIAPALLSCVFWTGFLFSRMSSFLFVPLLYGCLVMTVFLIEDRRRRNALLAYFSGLLGLLVLSFVVYAHFQNRLYNEIFGAYLLQPLGNDPYLKMALLGVVAAAVPIVGILNVKRWRLAIIRIFNHRWLRTGIVIVIYLLFVAYLSRYFFSHKWDGMITHVLAHGGMVSGWRRIATLSLWNTLLYLSPFGFGIYLYILWKERLTKNHIELALLLFSAFYLLVYILMNPVVRGGYYWARYQMSEIVPYSLLAVVICFWKKKGQPHPRMIMMKRALAALMLIYFAGYSINLFKGKEWADTSFFKTIRQTLTQNDLLVFEVLPEARHGYNGIVQPLEYFYDLHMIRSDARQVLKTPEFLKMAYSFETAYLLSEEDFHDPCCEKVLDLAYRQGMFHNNTGHLYLPWAKNSGSYHRGRGFRSISLPAIYSEVQKPYYLYKLNRD